MPPEFQDNIHKLFAHPEKIVRNVDFHANGYLAETTTTDPALVSVLQSHVAQMSGRLGGGQRVRRWDPAFEEFFAHYDDMEHKFTRLDNGIRAEITGKTPEAIAAAHNHARIIFDFSALGESQMHQPHRTLLDKDGGESNRFQGGPPDARAAELAETFAARADAASDALIQTLGGQLKAALEAGGPEAALPVCRSVAIPLTDGTAEQFDGLSITRVTDKPRNPSNSADKIDLQVIAHFKDAPEKPKLLAHLTTAPDGKTIRHYRPLVTSQICLKCHGAPNAMSATLQGLIKDAYPDDKAHGYQLGELRGLIRVEASE